MFVNSLKFSRGSLPQQLRHDAAAIIKLVPVRVLDSNSRPVRGLNKEDFVLYDNGRPQVITEFEVHEPLRDKIMFKSEVVRPEIQQEVNRKYFFVLDMQGSGRIGNQKAKEVVLAFASSHLQPGDQVCLLTFGAFTGLVLRQYLTADMDKIAKALDKSIEMGSVVKMPLTEEIEIPSDNVDDIAERLGGRSESTTEARGEANTIVDRPVRGEQGFPTRIVAPSWGSLGRSWADFDMSMSELAKAFAYIQGSKTVVYFSTRIPSRGVSSLFAEANATVYAVNTNSVPPSGGGAYASRQRRQKEIQGQALTAFAEASGGRYFAEVADADTIAREVAELSGFYYVLGYYISPSWDGRVHHIRVEVVTPGLRVLVQSGYNDPKPFDEWTDIEKRLHLFNLALSDQPVETEALDLPLKVLTGLAETGTNTVILMKLQVDERTSLPPGRTEVYAFVVNQDCRVVTTWRGELDTASITTKMLYPYIATRLSPGRYECRAVFREMNTGRSAAARHSFVVPEPPVEKRGPSIFAPPLLLEETTGEFVRLAKPGSKSRPEESLLSFYPFWPRNCFPLFGASERGEVRALLQILATDAVVQEENVTIELIDEEGGEPMPLEWYMIDCRIAENRVIQCLLEIMVKNKGQFRIKFTVTDESTKAEDVAVISCLKR
jgi:VWFA-related protein